MKTFVILLVLSILLSATANAKVIISKDIYYIENKNGNIPLLSVNAMIKEKSISKIVLYGNGSANLISFATKNGPVKLYSIDEKGFTYSIEPFASYNVTSTDQDGKFEFKEVPKRKYYIDAKGFFFY